MGFLFNVYQFFSILPIVILLALNMFQHGYNRGVVNSPYEAITKCSIPDHQYHGISNLLRDCIPMNTLEWSIAVGIFSVGGLISAPIGPWVSDIISRRTILFYATIFNTIGGFLMFGFSEIATFMIGRFFCGVACGIYYSVSGIYLVEISPPKIRGIISGFSGIGITTGLLFQSILGLFLSKPGFSWRILFLTSTIIGVFQIITFPLIPHSPRWLMLKYTKLSLKYKKNQEKKKQKANIHKMNDSIQDHDIIKDNNSEKTKEDKKKQNIQIIDDISPNIELNTPDSAEILFVKPTLSNQNSSQFLIETIDINLNTQNEPSNISNLNQSNNTFDSNLPDTNTSELTKYQENIQYNLKENSHNINYENENHIDSSSNQEDLQFNLNKENAPFANEYDKEFNELPAYIKIYKYNAIKALSFYQRGVSHEGIMEEINEIEKSNIDSLLKSSGLRELFQLKVSWRLFIAIFLQTSIELCGSGVLSSYSQMLFDKSGIPRGDIWNVLLFFFDFLGSVLCGYTFDRFGRKKSLIFCQILLFLGVTLFAISFALLSIHITFSILCIFSMVVVIFFFSMGIAPLGVLISVEMFSNTTRGYGVSISSMSNWAVMTIMLFVFPSYIEWAGQYAIIPFSVLNLIFLIFYILFVPETKGKLEKVVSVVSDDTVEEIETQELKEVEKNENEVKEDEI